MAKVDREWRFGGLAEWKPMLVDLGCRTTSGNSRQDLHRTRRFEMVPIGS
jgi:hypothetical protein